MKLPEFLEPLLENFEIFFNVKGLSYKGKFFEKDLGVNMYIPETQFVKRASEEEVDDDLRPVILSKSKPSDKKKNLMNLLDDDDEEEEIKPKP